jgi:small-conductance mechanosensitive channel
MDLNEALRWLIGRGAALLAGTVVLLLAYRVGVYAIHRFVPAVIHAQAAHLPSKSSSTEEMDKRIRTIEDLLLRLLRVALLAGLVAMALAVFDLTVVLAAIVVVLVAILFATQDVVLDYVMGFLLLVEGPFFKGDYVVVRDHTGVEGVVEEIGLRRTLLRDQNGSSHAVSNGLIRLSSNLTRLFSVAVVELHVMRAADLERALSTAAEVAAEMRRDPVWAERFDADAGTDISITGIGTDGVSLRVQQRVLTGAQAAVASELRRRLSTALVAASIGTGRWDTPMPIISQPADPSRSG